MRYIDEQETTDSEAPDPLEVLMRQEAVSTAISRFVELPTIQRSVVILKDVLDHSLEDIAALLGITAQVSTFVTPELRAQAGSLMHYHRLIALQHNAPGPRRWPWSEGR
jgi:hypothetical protein